MLVLVENVGILFFQTEEDADVFLWDMCEEGYGISRLESLCLVWRGS